MKQVPPRIKKYVDQLQARASSYVNKYTPEEKNDIDPEYKGMLVDDAVALFTLSQLILVGKLDDAKKMAEGLDTAVREEIPTGVWNFLTDGHDF
jgi:hypothetical protein